MLVAIAALALACYANSLRGALLFDDINTIVENHQVRAPELRGLFLTPSWGEPGEASYNRMYRPLTTLTFAANYAVGQFDPVGYHAVNVLLHAVVCVLLALVLGEVTGRPRLAGFAALLFAAHPVHTEAVASVVGRAEELAALLGLGAWWLVLRSRRSARRRGVWLAAAAVTLAAGFLCKENVAAIPAMVIAADLIVGPGWSRARVAEYVALSVGASAALGLHTVAMGSIGNSPGVLDNVLADAPPVPRLLTAMKVIALYARRLIWPLDLSADYSYRQIELVSGLGDAGSLAGVGVVVGAALLAAWGWRHARVVCLAIALAALPFVIVSNVFITIGTIMAERLLYLPSIGFCLLIASGADALARGPRRALVGWAVTAALVAFYAPATMRRNRVWREPRGFFEAMVTSAPHSARSHRELGLVYSSLGLHDQAVAELRLALDILPGELVNLYNLGNVYLRAGRYPEAIAMYRSVLEQDADFLPAITNLGNAYSAAGDEPAAEPWFRAGLAREPDSLGPRLNLANSLMRQGRMAEAEPEYRAAVALAPDNALVRVNYGIFLVRLGRSAEGMAQLQQAAVLPPPTPQAAIAVVSSLVALKMSEAAHTAQAVAERRFPDDPDVRRLRGALESQAGG